MANIAMALEARILVKLGTADAHFDLSWQEHEDTASGESRYFQCVDIIFNGRGASNLQWHGTTERESKPRIFVTTLSSEETKEIKHEHFGDSAPAAWDFLLTSLQKATCTSEGYRQAIRLIVPRPQGFIIRSDIFNLRLLDCPLVSAVVSFCKPKRRFTSGSGSLPLSSIFQLPEIFAASCAGILLSPSPNAKSDLEALDYELRSRLSFPWLIEQTRSKQALAIVEGGKSPETGRNLFMAAKALDISIIVLDRPGHWLEGPEYADWREAFLPIDRNPDPKFPDRIVDSLERYGKGRGALKIDGLTTFFDPLFPGVAVAAERLGLMPSDPQAYIIATDKFKTSVAEGRTAYRASSAEEAVRAAQDVQGLSYPLVVKPCSGWGSEGVFRVENEAELKDAVGAIDFERHGKDIVIEEYCDGPEVDANFVLIDGEVAFFEASDDFPKDADGEGGTALKTFIEVANVLPSTLPPKEMTILKNSLHQSLLKLGFKNGFFHLEARVKDSSMEFWKDDTTGLVDLRSKKSKSDAGPTAWLIEINPRPPGVQALLASARTYGVDYIGIALCFALQDKTAAEALSTPFTYEKPGNGAQYWCEIVFIPVVEGGIFRSEDVCADLYERRPDLAAHISKSHCFFQSGDTVPDPSSGLLNWIAYYLVFSHQSRAHVLELAESVRRENRFVITQ